MTQPSPGHTGTEPVTHTSTESAITRLLRKDAERQRCEAEYEAEKAERARRHTEFRAVWDATWKRFLGAFSYSDGFRVTDPPRAGAALADVGPLVAQLPNLSWYPERKAVTEWLQHLCEYDGWREPGPATAAALLLDAVRGATAGELADQLRSVDGSETLRIGFAWLRVFRDGLLPLPPVENPEIPGVYSYYSSEPVGSYSLVDLRYTERVLMSGAPRRQNPAPGWAAELVPAHLGATSAPPDGKQQGEETEPAAGGATAAPNVSSASRETRAADSGGVGGTDERSVPAWEQLPPAKRAILEVLARAPEALQNALVAKRAGYKEGTLRHHYQELQNWNLVRSTSDGYLITPAGRALIPADPV